MSLQQTSGRNVYCVTSYTCYVCPHAQLLYKQNRDPLQHCFVALLMAYTQLVTTQPKFIH